MAWRYVQKAVIAGCAGAVTHNLKGSPACHSIWPRHNWTMHDVDSKISDAVRHAPEWVRHDLLSSDKVTRIRAEMKKKGHDI